MYEECNPEKKATKNGKETKDLQDWLYEKFQYEHPKKSPFSPKPGKLTTNDYDSWEKSLGKKVNKKPNNPLPSLF